VVSGIAFQVCVLLITVNTKTYVAASLVNQPEVLDFIHAGEKVKVFRETIISLSGDSVILSSGEKCRTDAVIFATGYNISEPIYSPELAGELGVSIDVQSYPPHLAEKWDNLESAADIEVLESFPRLKEAPACNQKPVPYTPYRLYQTILPPALAEKEDRSLVFVGPVGPLNTAL
jgi:dimethylaniline monooxygenase (N-oxide forming)